MSLLYLIDAHTTVLANSPINDVIQADFGETVNVTGNFVVNIPSGVVLEDAAPSLSSLLTQKYAAVFSRYPGFAEIVYDDMLDDSGIDDAGSVGITTGSRGSNSLLANGSEMLTQAVNLGSAPTDCIFTWEVFQYTVSNPSDGPGKREYQEVDPASITVELSFDNGSTFTEITEGVYFSIPLGAQGSQFVAKFSNASSNRYWIGSWALMY